MAYECVVRSNSWDGVHVCRACEIRNTQACRRLWIRQCVAQRKIAGYRLDIRKISYLLSPITLCYLYLESTYLSTAPSAMSLYNTSLSLSRALYAPWGVRVLVRVPGKNI